MRSGHHSGGGPTACLWGFCMKKYFACFLRDEEGLTMVEYAIAGSLVAATAAFTFTNLGNAIVAAINTLIADM